jgi:hypothetical protein
MTLLLLPKNCRAFALDWIAAWNSRDLTRILRHYAPEVEFSSPFVSRLIGPDHNTVRGLAVLRLYFTRALNAYPDLCFTFRRVYEGANSVVVEYETVEGRLAAEMMRFDEAGLISKVDAHYWTETSRTDAGG